ncbi:MAG: radical SAM protein [Bacillota bacterium]
MKLQKVRFEHFGGIISTEDPVGLFWVDRDFLKTRGYDGGQVWSEPGPGYLSAPVELEIQVTGRCDLACSCCYMDSGGGRQDTESSLIQSTLEIASRMGIFHVAFSGGEPLMYPGLLCAAEAARESGLIPATTTNGTLVTPTWARAAASLFARVNVSADVKGGPRDDRADLFLTCRAVAILRDAGVTCGVNFIVTNQTTGELETVFRETARAGADSILILRPKPDGRGRRCYESLRLTQEQAAGLISRLVNLSGEWNLPFHLDCALAPLLLCSGVDSRLLDLFGAAGCIAGDLLLTVDGDGMVHPCSHVSLTLGHVSEFPDAWHGPLLQSLRARSASLEGRCAACDVSRLCGGGCLAVNEYYGLGMTQPDPDLRCKGEEPAVRLVDLP